MFSRFFYIFLFLFFGSLSFARAEGYTQGDVAKGEKLFKRCAMCHQVGEGAKNRVGPILTGIIGRPAGSIEDYKYGKDMKKMAETGLVWTEDLIFEWLADPKQFLRDRLDDPKAKTKMTFRLKKDEDRNDIITYLSTFSTE